MGIALGSGVDRERGTLRSWRWLCSEVPAAGLGNAGEPRVPLAPLWVILGGDLWCCIQKGFASETFVVSCRHGINWCPGKV